MLDLSSVLLNILHQLFRFSELRKHFSKQLRLRKIHLNMVLSIKLQLLDKLQLNLKVKYLVLLLQNALCAFVVMPLVSPKMPKSELNPSNMLKKDLNSLTKTNKVVSLLNLKRNQLRLMNLLDLTTAVLILPLNSRNLILLVEMLRNLQRRRKSRLNEQQHQQ